MLEIAQFEPFILKREVEREKLTYSRLNRKLLADLVSNSALLIYFLL